MAIPVFIIAVFLLRALFVKTFLSPKPQASYVNSFATSIFSYFTLMISYALPSILFSIDTCDKAYIAAVFTIILSILLDCGILKYFFRKANWTRVLLILLVLNTFTWGMLIYILIGCTSYREDCRRRYCTSNLKQIGLSLKQYAMDYDDYFPDKGLEQLRSNDYLTDIMLYNCPSTKTQKLKTNQQLTKENVDYIYQAGLQDPPVDGKDSSKIPVLWDKPTNHENYGNVLFLDCHVKGFKGKDWMEQAGIKKTATQQGK